MRGKLLQGLRRLENRAGPLTQSVDEVLVIIDARTGADTGMKVPSDATGVHPPRKSPELTTEQEGAFQRGEPVHMRDQITGRSMTIIRLDLEKLWKRGNAAAG